jgi:hypothetical protein
LAFLTCGLLAVFLDWRSERRAIERFGAEP